MAKSVVTGLPTYVTQTVWLPRKTTQLINRATKDFIWSSSSSERGWHLVNWDTVKKGKKEGVLGVRDIVTANTAILGKSVWTMLHQPEKLWVKVVSHKYLKQNNILNVPVV